MNTINLKKARESACFTQSSAAKALGISESAYKNYEHGNREPSNELLCKIADLYDVSTDYLLGREPAPDPFGDLDLSAEDEKAVLAKYMSLPENVRAMMLDVIRQLGNASGTSESEQITAAILENQLDTEAEAKEDAG